MPTESVVWRLNVPFLFYDTLEVSDCGLSVNRRQKGTKLWRKLRQQTVKLKRSVVRSEESTLYLSVPCCSCLSSLSSTVNCRVMPSIRAYRPRYSLYSALKSFLYLWRCSGEPITVYFLWGREERKSMSKHKGFCRNLAQVRETAAGRLNET